MDVVIILLLILFVVPFAVGVFAAMVGMLVFAYLEKRSGRSPEQRQMMRYFMDIALIYALLVYISVPIRVALGIDVNILLLGFFLIPVAIGIRIIGYFDRLPVAIAGLFRERDGILPSFKFTKGARRSAMASFLIIWIVGVVILGTAHVLVLAVGESDITDFELSDPAAYAVWYHFGEFDEDYGPLDGMRTKTAVLVGIVLIPLLLSAIISFLRSLSSGGGGGGGNSGVTPVERPPRRVQPEVSEPDVAVPDDDTPTSSGNISLDLSALAFLFRPIIIFFRAVPALSTPLDRTPLDGIDVSADLYEEAGDDDA